MGGLLSERSGVANLCLEGKILMGAFGAITGTILTGNPWGGIAFAILLSVCLAALHAFLCLNLRVNAFVSGIIINQLSFSVTGVLIAILFDNKKPTVEVSIPTLSFGNLVISPIFLFSIFITVLSMHFLHRSYLKSLIFSCGDCAIAALRCGISVKKTRFAMVLIAGLLCGIAGSHLSIGIMDQFNKGMSSGHGFLAIGAIILGSWKPFPTFIACGIMAAVEVAQTELQIFPNIPYQFGYMASYAIIFLVMIIRKGEMSAPLEIGK